MDSQQESLFASSVMGCNGEKLSVMATALLQVWRIAVLLWTNAMMPLGKPHFFFHVHRVSNTNTAHILLISDGMTVSVRSRKRHPESCWQKYWRRRNYISSTGFPVCPWDLILLFIVQDNCVHKVFCYKEQWCLLAQCDKTCYYRSSKNSAQRHRETPCQNQKRPHLPSLKPGPWLRFFWQAKQ